MASFGVTLLICLATTLLSADSSHAFIAPRSSHSSSLTLNHVLFATKRVHVNDEDVSFLLKEFAFYNGEIIDPYQTLKIHRQADESAVKNAYHALCRRYHPDAARYNDILPGSFDNETQVREQWERITWSYTLLSRPTQRRKYDRHYALAYPGRAIRRAAANAAWSGLSTVSVGLWNMSTMAVSKMMEWHDEQVQQHLRKDNNNDQHDADATNSANDENMNDGHPLCP